MASFIFFNKKCILYFNNQIVKNYSCRKLSYLYSKTRLLSKYVCSSYSLQRSCSAQESEKVADSKRGNSGILTKALTRIKLFAPTPRSQPVRGCFHPGASALSSESIQLTEKGPVTGQEMIKAMLLYIWPKDDETIRNRVSLAVGLLIGAKVMNVGVPFIFKYAVEK
ncbi:hypothetical protein QE152_g15604 [Popillia japonica]|uniref:Uncharacterized protein n=1 Tax=Popillia japonica TaxID=7064 RepID=A0AAW1L591_POPJA